MLKMTRFFAMALALMMSFATITSLSLLTAQAAGGPIIAPDEETPIEVSIRKVLRMPIGTDTPAADFNFETEKINLDGDTSQTALDKMPNLNTDNMTVSFTVDDKDTNDLANNTVSVVNTTDNILEGIVFPQAGIYVYEITEEQFTNNKIDTNAPHEILTYSKAVYTLRVYVFNTEDYKDTYISAIAIIVKTPDDFSQDEGDKVAQLTFTNDYLKTNTSINPSEDSTLFVSKTVTGDLGNRDLYFNFSMTLAVPALVDTPPSYFRAYVVDEGAETNPIDPVDNAAASLIDTDSLGSYIKISTGGFTNFKLKHGQRLVFVDTPVGTSYVAEESPSVGYLSSVIVTTNDIEAAPITTASGTLLRTGIQLVGEAINSAAFINERAEVIPTGVNVDDLPFVGMIAFPTVALIGFIVFKSRKKNHAA